MDPVLMAVCIVMTFAGAALGLFSGLVPGIHVNTLSSLMLASYPAIQGMLSGMVDPTGAAMAVCCCVMSASVVHSFVDFVPSVFIGAPDAEDAVSILPGHRLLLEGRGMDAVKAAASGSLVGACCAVLLAVPLQYVMSTTLGDVTDRLAWTVAFIASSVIVLGCGPIASVAYGIAAFILSGILGLAVSMLPIPCEGILGEGTLMFPMLAGLFGIPMLLTSGKGAPHPTQRPPCDEPARMTSGLRGVLMGCIAGWFPGITSTVGASMSSCIFRERSPEDFISNVASIGTVTSVLSVVALSVSGSGRSGTAIVLRELSGGMISGIASSTFLLVMLATAVSAFTGYWLTIWSGNRMASVMSGLDPRLLNRTVLAVNIILVLLLTGPCGLLILAVSTTIGMIPDSCGTSRIVLCGCLLLPILLPTV